MGLYLLAFIVLVLLAELSALSWVAGLLGSSLDAIALLLLLSVFGGWLTKRAGLGAVRRIRETSARGQQPSRELADGALIVAAGILLVVPGFVTGALGAALLLPPVRAGVRMLMLRRLAAGKNLVILRTRRRTSDDSRTTGGTREIWDADSWEEPRRSSQSEIGGPR